MYLDFTTNQINAHAVKKYKSTKGIALMGVMTDQYNNISENKAIAVDLYSVIEDILNDSSNLGTYYKIYPIGTIIKGSEVNSEDYQYHLCDGSNLNISEYQVLYNVLGPSYKVNNTEFKLPTLDNYIIRIK
jgi:hypothetical protein